MNILLTIVITLLFFNNVNAETLISSTVTRNQEGTSETFISSGFPLPPGLVTESLISYRKIKVTIDGDEVAANVSALRGRHSDGTVRSILIQFTVASMAQNDSLSAIVAIDGGVRTLADPVYVRPTFSVVSNNNVILPSDPAYISTTMITFRSLLPAGDGGAMEEQQYTSLADTVFDSLVISGYGGTAQYEDVLGMLGMWARTGNIKYWNHTVPFSFNWLKDFTPGSAATPICKADAYVNPDGRTPTNNAACGLASEWNTPRLLSFASMYLMTGYRDYWSVVAYFLQNEQSTISNQSLADTSIVIKGPYDTHRYNYSTKFAALIAANMIDATIDIPGQYYTKRIMNLAEQATMTLQALINTAWDMKWIPFDSGSGTVPADETVISQGGISATLLGVYPAGMFDSKRQATDVMPPTGYLQVKASTAGTFALGSLTGITASVSGESVDDYRNGMTGVRSDSPRVPNITQVTASISGTTMTVTAIPANTPDASLIHPGHYMSGTEVTQRTFVVNQIDGTPHGVGTYTIYPSQEVSSRTITVRTTLPVFQITFTNNFLIDYYLNINSDSRIPGLVKKNTDAFLENVRLMVPGDLYYGRSGGVWGNPLYGSPYQLENPPFDAANPFEIVEFPRALAFLIKTVGNETINGKTYSDWYSICIDTANVSPSVLSWTWKNFGQYYGWGMDAAWIMNQTALPEMAMRTPTYYAAIPADSPDVNGRRYRLFKSQPE